MTEKALFGKALDDFYHYLEKIVGVYEELKPVIREQIEIIGRADIKALDENLKIQQVLVQHTKDFDKKLTGHITGMGFEADTLTEFILQIPEAQQYRFYDLLGRFAAAVDEVSVYKNQCSTLLETKLYGIEKAIKKQGGPMGRIYEKDATEVENIVNAFEKDA